MTALTRRYHFSASHRLHSPLLSDTENARLYGKCNNPYGHGHDYTVDVTVAGPVDPDTGVILPVAALDGLVDVQILHAVATRNLNREVKEFAETTPTTENLALWIPRRLEESWPVANSAAGIRLTRVFVQETPRNTFEVRLPLRNGRAKSPIHSLESVPVHA